MENTIAKLQEIQETLSKDLRGVPSSRTDSRKRLVNAIESINRTIGELRHFQLGS